MTPEEKAAYLKMDYRDVSDLFWKRADEEGKRPLTSEESEILDQVFERLYEQNLWAQASSWFSGEEYVDE